MLRSELENIQAVLKDAAAWEAPDFFALAFYLIREEKDTLADMENGQHKFKWQPHFLFKLIY